MLVFAAAVLVLVVLVSLVLLLFFGMRQGQGGGWVGELRQWQGLIGSVLGFLGAAGVLVLSNAIEAEEAQARARQLAHAMGYGMALEAEKLSIGLATGRAIGEMIRLEGDPSPASTCLNYRLTLQRVLSPETPVFDAVLTNMVDFGDENLGVFVRFFSFYSEFLRGLDEIDEVACGAAAADEIAFMRSQIGHGIDYYAIIAGNYDVAPAARLEPTRSATRAADGPPTVK
jgi:hypothetical protein